MSILFIDFVLIYSIVASDNMDFSYCPGCFIFVYDYRYCVLFDLWPINLFINILPGTIICFIFRRLFLFNIILII